MSNQITQWLAQIKDLQQQLAEIQRDRQEAYASADHWRQLYNIEAQQRRNETKLAQQQAENLKNELRHLQGETPLQQVDQAEAALAIDQELASLETTEELKAKLKEVIIERDRLIDALKTEQANHAQTRKSLTAVIGDTIDQLAKERGTK